MNETMVDELRNVYKIFNTILDVINVQLLAILLAIIKIIHGLRCFIWNTTSCVGSSAKCSVLQRASDRA